MSANYGTADAFYIFFTIPIQPGNKLSGTR